MLKKLYNGYKIYRHQCIFCKGYDYTRNEKESYFACVDCREQEKYRC